jgi:hypothetical protein
MKKEALYLLLILPLFTGCFLMSSLQDGNTVGKKNVAMSFSVHGAKGTKPTFNPDNEDPNEDTSYKPIIQWSSSYGINEKFDLGFRINNANIITLTSKYQLLGSRYTKHGLSTGLDLSPTGIIIPLYYSYKFDPSGSIYLNAFYNPLVYPSLAINGGLILGQGSTKLALEIGHQRFLKGNGKRKYQGYTGGIGVFYYFGKDFKK